MIKSRKITVHLQKSVFPDIEPQLPQAKAKSSPVFPQAGTVERTQTPLKEILFLCLWDTFIYKDSNFSRLSCKSQAGKQGVLLGSGHCPAGSLGGDFLSSLLGWFQLAMSLLAHVLYTCSLPCGTTWGGDIKLLEDLWPCS